MRTAKKITLALLAAMTWFALVLQFRIILNNGPAGGMPATMQIANFFSYFTILSNIWVAVCCTSCLLLPATSTGKFFSKVTVQSAIAVYIFIVGLVYNLVLRRIWSPTGWQLVADNLLHVAVPVAFVLYWFFFTTRQQLQWKDIFPWLLFPALYLVYSLIRGEATGWYPYPFVDAAKLGYGRVAVNSLGVLAAIIAAGSGIIAINRVNKRQ